MVSALMRRGWAPVRRDKNFRRRSAAFWPQAGSVPLIAVLAAWTILAGGCAGKPKPPATGPLRVKAQLVNSDGSAASTANLHLLTVVRDAQGDLSQVTEHFGNMKISENPSPTGSITLEIPRDLVSAGGEFSLPESSQRSAVPTPAGKRLPDLPGRSID